MRIVFSNNETELIENELTLESFDNESVSIHLEKIDNTKNGVNNYTDFYLSKIDLSNLIKSLIFLKNNLDKHE